jgi:hypothetical protein
MEVSWTTTQAILMAEVIPVIALALGLEMREVRHFFDAQQKPASSGRHAATVLLGAEQEAISALLGKLIILVTRRR